MNTPWLCHDSYFTWEELSWDFTSAIALRTWIASQGLDLSINKILHVGKDNKPEGSKDASVKEENLPDQEESKEATN